MRKYNIYHYTNFLIESKIYIEDIKLNQKNQNKTDLKYKKFLPSLNLYKT